MAGFRWTEKAEKAAIALAQGETRVDVCRENAIAERTLYNWLANPEFSAEVDRLTLMTGIASRAERLRIAKQAAKMRTPGGMPLSKADLIDWLKFAQSETDGIKLDLAALAEAYALVAGGRPQGADGATEADGE